eukprot:gene11131-7921_t
MTALFLYLDNQSKDIESSTAILHHDLSHIDVNVEGGVQVANSLVEEASDALATVYLVGAVYGALVGFAVSSLIMSMLDIAVATVLVCLAEDSEDMERRNRHLAALHDVMEEANMTRGEGVPLLSDDRDEEL